MFSLFFILSILILFICLFNLLLRCFVKITYFLLIYSLFLQFIFIIFYLFCYLLFYFIFPHLILIVHKLSILMYFKSILFNYKLNCKLYVHSDRFAINRKSHRKCRVISFTIICKSLSISLGAELSHKFVPVYRLLMKREKDAGLGRSRSSINRLN